MGNYTITFKASVEKDLRKLPTDRASHILEVIESLSDDPVPKAARKLYSTEGFYRVRAGDYLVIYKIVHETRDVVIFYLAGLRRAEREGLTLQGGDESGALCPRICRLITT